LSSLIDNLSTDQDFRSFVRKETDKVPVFLIEKVRKDLGLLWQWLPVESL
jgi:hypothetical protein